MAQRPLFLPSTSPDRLVDEILISFEWHKGMAPSQKIKNVKEMHKEIKGKSLGPTLEVSTKSSDSLGISLSAFNLHLYLEGKGNSYSLESIFQSSKVFEGGGPFAELLGKDGRDIKKSDLIKDSGRLIKFKSPNGDEWPLSPQTAFYDWIYLNAVNASNIFPQDICDFNSFTDIEFNPKKSINCQARSCALFVSLRKKGLLETALDSPDQFRKILISHDYMCVATQGDLFPRS